jgi:hypothetical protein
VTRRGAAAVTVAALVGLASCSDGGEPRTEAPGTTASVPVLGPGTELTSGLEVPPGARLLGRVFPDTATYVESGEDPATSEWVALLLVEGDGRSSHDDLLDQARDLGFVDDPELGPPSCYGPTDCSARLARGDARIDVRFVVGACPNTRGASHIELSGSGGTRAQVAPTTRTVDAPRTAPPSTVPPSTRVEETGPGASSTVPPPTGGSIPPYPLPRPGELLNDRGTYEAAPVRLEPGSRAAGPPMIGCDNSSSHRSVLVFDAPVERLVDAYARQWAGYSHDPGVIRSETIGDVRLTFLTVEEGGGDEWYLTVAEEPDEPTYAFVSSDST